MGPHLSDMVVLMSKNKAAISGLGLRYLEQPERQAILAQVDEYLDQIG